MASPEPQRDLKQLLSRGIRSGTVRLRRRMEDLSPQELRRSRADWPEVLERVPALRTVEHEIQRTRSELGAAHRDYCARIGHPVHAASLELVGLLRCLLQDRLEKGGPLRVVDLGSGFTSFALRSAAAGQPVEVHSVDDSPEWLEKTRAYLDAQGVNSENLHTWTNFGAATRKGTFDLVLHDMGFMDFRFETLDLAVDLAGPGGLVVLDDMHKREYRDQALQRLTERGIPAWSLKRATRDNLLRYAYLSLR
jgi:predicted O-methyltransferase YrrM